VPGNLDLLLVAEDGLFETKFQIVAEIFAALRSVAVAAPAGTEKFPKNITENVLEAGSEIESTAERTTLAKCTMTELVVEGPFLRIRKNLVSLRNFFKGFLRLLVPRVAVGMILQCQFPVGFFNFFFTGISFYPQEGVIVFVPLQSLAPRK
jgi:hypothetical protein